MLQMVQEPLASSREGWPVWEQVQARRYGADLTKVAQCKGLNDVSSNFRFSLHESSSLT